MNRYEVILLMKTGSQPMVKETVKADDVDIDESHYTFTDEYGDQVAWYPREICIVKLVEEDIEEDIDDDNE
jgi:hypothetical protein